MTDSTFLLPLYKGANITFFQQRNSGKKTRYSNNNAIVENSDVFK